MSYSVLNDMDSDTQLYQQLFGIFYKYNFVSINNFYTKTKKGSLLLTALCKNYV